MHLLRLSLPCPLSAQWQKTTPALPLEKTLQPRARYHPSPHPWFLMTIEPPPPPPLLPQHQQQQQQQLTPLLAMFRARLLSGPPPCFHKSLSLLCKPVVCYLMILALKPRTKSLPTTLPSLILHKPDPNNQDNAARTPANLHHLAPTLLLATFGMESLFLETKTLCGAWRFLPFCQNMRIYAANYSIPIWCPIYLSAILATSS